MALVVTFEAPDSLARCLDSVLAQTHPPGEVVILDNGTAGRAAAALPNQGSIPVRLVELGSNLGPAGGHAEGLRRFLASGHAWAWVMDDDCVPEPDCLERLVGLAGDLDRPGLVFPTWIDALTGETTDWPAWCGVMIPAEIVDAVGVPREDFFWWAEDTEYLHWRIPQAGFDTHRATEARVHHHRVRASEVRPPWKVYYETRNSIYYRLRIQRGRGRRFYRLSRTLLRTLGAILIKPGRRAARFGAFLRGVFDGLSGHLGRPVEPSE